MRRIIDRLQTGNRGYKGPNLRLSGSLRESLPYNAIMVVVAVALLAAQVAAAPSQLNDSTFASVKAHASPTKQDLSFQGIDWKTSIFDGLAAAKREDRPMLMWMYFGDPRGKC